MVLIDLVLLVVLTVTLAQDAFRNILLRRLKHSPFLSRPIHQIQAAWRTDEIRRQQPTPQDEMRHGMSYLHETIWKGVPQFLRRIDTALRAIGIEERLPYNLPVIQFSSWMGGDRDGETLPKRKRNQSDIEWAGCALRVLETYRCMVGCWEDKENSLTGRG